MAIIETPRPVPFGAVATLSVVNLISNTFNRFTRSINAAKTRKSLVGLSNQQLDDIGLMPGDIQSIVHRVTLLH